MRSIMRRKYTAIFWASITGLTLYGIIPYIFVSFGYMYHMLILVINLLFWTVFISILVLATLWFMIKQTKKKKDPAIQILKERFARGEISQEDFKQKSILLRKS